MTKPYNKKLNQDITKLKTLHAKKDKTEFNKMKSEIMKRHSVSKATVYRELKKGTPGLYKRPQYNPPVRPVTERERQMVEELLINQYKVQDIVLIMEREFSQSYSWDRIDRIRETITNYELEIKNEKQVEAELHEAEIPQGGKAKALSIKIPFGKLSLDTAERNPASAGGSGSQSRGVYETAFGENLRVFLEELFSTDKIAEGRTLEVNISGTQYRLNRRIIKDIMLIIANYADCSINTPEEEKEETEKINVPLLFVRPEDSLEEILEGHEIHIRMLYNTGYFKKKFDDDESPDGNKSEGTRGDMTGLNQTRIFHLMMDKIRTALGGSYISPKELKELNELNKYFRENSAY